MKAAVLTGTEMISYQEIPAPRINTGECLIRVRYAGVCGTDIHIYEGHHPTAKIPVILGHEFVGTVEELSGANPGGIKIGDRVVADPKVSCGQCEACLGGQTNVCADVQIFGVHLDGGFAEFVKVPLKKTIAISDAVPDRVAGLIEPFSVGHHVYRVGGQKQGDRILVIGGGPIGLSLGMVAKVKGASMVVYAEINAERRAQIKAFGFEHVVNPLDETCMAELEEITGKKWFDLVYEGSGSQSALLFSTEACMIGGKLVAVGFPAGLPQFNVLQVIMKELTVVGSRASTYEDFVNTVPIIEEIVASGLFDLEKMISSVYRLPDLELAIREVMGGTNLGKILIDCGID